MNKNTFIIPQESKYLQESWFNLLIDDCKAIIVERFYNSNLEAITAYGEVGERIFEDENYQKYGKGNREFNSILFTKIGLGERTGYYCLEFYERKLKPLLGEKKATDVCNAIANNYSKNISWRKIIAMLPEIREDIQLPDNLVLPDDLKIINGDFRTTEIEKESVDLILTDPPYPGEFLPLWDDLAAFAQKVLKPGGWLVSYSGQYHLPKVLNSLLKTLNYFWTYCLFHKTGGSRLVRLNIGSSNPSQIMNLWKPVIVFYKPPLKKLNSITSDILDSEQREKEYHDWQQSESGVKKLIELFSKPGELVIDPFSGSGTFAKVAFEMKRKAIGIEIDKISYKQSVKRIYDKTKI